MPPKISVVIPVYNAERWLARCVDSLLEQTLSEIEVVLVDDGSTDTSPALVDAYAARDERVKALHTENRGPAAARHTGVHAATGEYLTFQDNDDYRPLDALRGLYECARASGADYVSGNYLRSRRAGSPEFVLVRQPKSETSDALHALRNWLNGEMAGMLWTLLVKRELYTENIHSFPPLRVGDDVAMFAQLTRHAKKWVQWDAPVYCYVLRRGSISGYEQSWSRWMLLDEEKVTEWLLDYLEALPGREVFADALAFNALLRLGAIYENRGNHRIDLSALEARVRRDYYPNRTARRRLRRRWPKRYIFLMAERHAGWRIVKKILWGTPFMRRAVRAARNLFRP